MTKDGDGWGAGYEAEYNGDGGTSNSGEWHHSFDGEGFGDGAGYGSIFRGDNESSLGDDN